MISHISKLPPVSHRKGSNDSGCRKGSTDSSSDKHMTGLTRLKNIMIGRSDAGVAGGIGRIGAGGIGRSTGGVGGNSPRYILCFQLFVSEGLFRSLKRFPFLGFLLKFI